MSTNSQKQQKWIESYKSAYDQMDAVQAKLSAIIFLLQPTDSVRDFELDLGVREGLHLILKGLSAEMHESLHDKMPLPDIFARLCGGASHE